MNQTSGRILKNSIAITAAKGAITAVRTAFLLIIARWASVDEFGRIALCFATVEVLRVICDFGTETYFIRAMARALHPAIQREHLKSLRSFRILSAGLGFLAYLVIIFVVFTERVTLLEASVGALLLTALATNYAFAYYQARLEMYHAIVPVIVPATGYCIYVMIVGARSGGALLGGLISYEAVASFWLIANVMREVPSTADPKMVRLVRLSVGDVVRHTWPIAGAIILVTVYTRLDVFAVTEIAGMVALGLYSFAFRLTEPSRYVASSVDSTLYSHLARRFTAKEGRGAQHVRTLYLVVLAYSLGIAVFTAVVAGEALGYFYPRYLPALPALYILCGALFFRCINGYQGAVQNALGHYSMVLKFTIVNFMLMLVLIYPLIRLFGIDGAALTLLTVESVNCIMQGYAMKQTLTSLGTKGDGERA